MQKIMSEDFDDIVANDDIYFVYVTNYGTSMEETVCAHALSVADVFRSRSRRRFDLWASQCQSTRPMTPSSTAIRASPILRRHRPFLRSRRTTLSMLAPSFFPPRTMTWIAS